MKRKVILFFFVFLPAMVFSQVTTTTMTSGSQLLPLLQNNFQGEGIEILEVSFNNLPVVPNTNQIGTFANNDTNGNKIKATQGIIMATGSVNTTTMGYGFSSAVPQYNDFDMNAVWVNHPCWNSQYPLCDDGWNYCPQLMNQNLSEANQDVGSIAFTFIPMGTSVDLQYVFSSDAYPYYVPYPYGCTFGIFISGPYDNAGNLDMTAPYIYSDSCISLVPGKDKIVVPQNVNGGVCGGAVLGNSCECFCDLTNSQYYVGADGPGNTYGDIEQNRLQGFPLHGATVLLHTRMVDVEPCRKYKIVVGLGRGGVSYSFTMSAVFLQDSSFKAYNIITPDLDTTINDTICNGQTYNENGFNESIAGTYYDTIATACGDSIVTLHLALYTSIDTTIYDTICAGDVYIENGFNISDEGTYYDTLQTANGCDSIVILNLAVMPVYSLHIYDTICKGEVYSANGFNQTTSGTYNQNLQTSFGCDSIITLHLVVNDTFH
ncbi:MAG: choice-of-anchor L domain-containing protein, partial [Bacteroidales bacterium]|nr:choice-of-anchor L domain-containing protein [Bacteroidales bacterium]